MTVDKYQNTRRIAFASLAGILVLAIGRVVGPVLYPATDFSDSDTIILAGLAALAANIQNYMAVNHTKK